MKVLFDFDGFRGTVGGVPRCMAELIKHFPDDVDYKIAIEVCDNIHFLNSHLKPEVKPCKVNVNSFITKKYFPGKGRLFSLTEKLLPFFPSYININKPISIEALKEQDYDIFHCPSTTADTYFLDYLQKKPFVLTVHDMISELYLAPHNSQSRIKAKLVPLASHIVTVSHKSKEDLIRIMNVPEDKISVIYHGAPSISSTFFERYCPEPYFLCVGRRDGYKNFLQTLVDFSVFHKSFPEVKLITTGGHFTINEMKLINDLKIKGCVESVFASESELIGLYKNAIGFIFPSLYEGFGLPILEAFSYECPVLLNDTSCFPEIAKNAGIFFHSRPDEKRSNLPEIMRKVYTMSPMERRELIKKGNERRQYFSWEKSSKRLVEVYQKVLSL